MMLGYWDFGIRGNWDKRITLEDLKLVDEVYHKSLVHIRDNDVTDLEMTFQVVHTRLGETLYENLIEDGEFFFESPCVDVF